MTRDLAQLCDDIVPTSLTSAAFIKEIRKRLEKYYA